MEKDKLIKMLIGFLPLLLLFLDPPEGMDPKAWGLFPFYAGAILMVMLRPVGEATALAIFLGLYPENRGIYTQSDSSKKSSRNIWSLAVVSVDQRY